MLLETLVGSSRPSDSGSEERPSIEHPENLVVVSQVDLYAWVEFFDVES